MGRVESSRKADRSALVSSRGLGAAIAHPGVAVLIFLIAILKAGSLGLSMSRNFDPQDFSVYYASGLLLREGFNPYRNDLIAAAHRVGLETGHISQATDPPTFLLAVEPLSLLPAHKAYWTWEAINAAAFAAALLILLWPRWTGLSGSAALALAGFAILFPPVGNNFAIAQSKALVLLPLAAMIRCLERKRYALSGLMLAVAGLLRIFPFLLCVYFLIQRRWRMLGYTIAWTLVGGVITLALVGVDTSFGFLSAVNFLTMQQWLANTANIAISGFVSRVFWTLFGSAPGFWMDLARQGSVVGADLVLIYFVVRATVGGSREDRDWRLLSLWIVASVMLSPTAWFHYMILFLIPFTLMASSAARGRIYTRAVWMAIASYLMTGLVGVALTAIPQDPRLMDAVRELEFVCLLMVFVATYWFATDSPKQSQTPKTDAAAVAG